VFGRSGRDFAYLGVVPLSVPFGTPVTIPTASLPETTAGVPYSNANYAQYYKFAVNKRKDHLYGLTIDTPITDSLSVVATGYYEDKSGYGVSPEAYATSLASYNAERLVVAGLTAPRGLQYGLSVPGRHPQGRQQPDRLRTWASTPSPPGSGWRRTTITAPRRATTWRAAIRTGRRCSTSRCTCSATTSRRETPSSYFVKDTISLLDDRLKVDLGVKALDIDYQITGYRNPGDYIASRQPTIKKTWKDRFLPQVGAGVLGDLPRADLRLLFGEHGPAPRRRRRVRGRQPQSAGAGRRNCQELGDRGIAPTGRRSTPRWSATRPRSTTGCSRSPRSCRARRPPRPSSRTSAR
jgi:iron complex outermembrane receptor protein